MMGKDANSSKKKVKTPMSNEKEYQEYLIAAAEKLVEHETERLKNEENFLETDEKLADFHDLFFEKLGARLAKDVAKATDSSLGEHGVPEEVAMKVNEFQGTSFQLSYMIPAKVMALLHTVPSTVFSELWREEGERLIAAEIRRMAKEGQRRVMLFICHEGGRVCCDESGLLQAWLDKGCSYSEYLTDDRDKIVSELLSAFEGAGYTKESHEGRRFVHEETRPNLLVSLNW
eukprot:g5239.t1